MTWLARLAREPLIHFVLIGAAVFGVYTLFSGGGEEPRDRIVVTDGRIEQLAQIFNRTWQRPPSEEEMRGLVESYVKEEIFYREAIRLGLDRDDTLVRRRMQQKMEYLTEPDDTLLRADDADLKAYLEANRSAFRVEPQFAFDQVFLKRGDQGEAALARADRVRNALNEAAVAEAAVAEAAAAEADDAGDPTLLPASIRLSPLSQIARSFGDGFADSLERVAGDEWAGPIESPFGLHLVRVTGRVDGYDPDIEEIRDDVAQRWRDAQRQAFKEAAYGQLRARYEIVMPSPGTATAEDGDTPR